jgi:hypothetical protein
MIRRDLLLLALPSLIARPTIRLAVSVITANAARKGGIAALAIPRVEIVRTGLTYRARIASLKLNGTT